VLVEIGWLLHVVWDDVDELGFALIFGFVELSCFVECFRVDGL